VTATPVPESGTGIKPEKRLFAIAKLATNVPVPGGVKVTFIEQLAPADKFPTQLLVSAKSEALAPFIEMLVIARAVDSLLVSVTVWDALVVPAGRFANDKLAGVAARGSYNSAPAWAPLLLLKPPATRTVPLFKRVEVCALRGVLRLPFCAKVCAAGSYSSAPATATTLT
jgi:hypothetical protein